MIPDTVTIIPAFAFISCSSLKSVIIPSTVTVIGFSINIHYPNIVITILIILERYAFHQTGLTSVVIPEGVTSIGWWAFAQSYSLSSITIADSVTSLANGVFNQCPFTCINWNPAITRTAVGDTFSLPYDKALTAEDALSITCP